jgi:hypothetical protein
MHAAGYLRLLIGIASFVAALAATVPLTQSDQDIVYISGDLQHVAVFSPTSARFGPRLALGTDWPSSPARYFEPSEHVQCVSVGPPGNPPGNTVEFAIKRPIRAGERYRCLTTSFRVIRCFDRCRAAVIEIVSQLGGHARGTLTSHMYVDACLGVVVISSFADNLTEGIPHEAPLLRGRVGILADPGRC